VKAGLAARGLIRNELRLPMTRVSRELEESLARLVV